MIKIQNKEICSGCTACVMICPKKCIIMERDKLGFTYPGVERDMCVNCGLCENVCPELKIPTHTSQKVVTSFVSVGKNEEIRKRSSSGGVFSLLAQHIISNGGVVFGVAYDSTFHSVKHTAVDSLEELESLQGSKYLQSMIGDSYKECKTYLMQGRLVLFTGTPCQISGLKAFLGKDYNNLYLQDIICHGVPSPAVWDAYLEYLESKFSGKAIDVSFRDKKNGWKDYLLTIKFDNGKEYSNNRSNDPYMRGFLHNLYLRPSCYECKHKGVERESDITLADCWGIENFCPELNDNKGTSLIIVSTRKGKKLLDNIVNELELREIDLDVALTYNQSIISSAKGSSERTDFVNEFQQKPIKVLMKKYCTISFFQKLRYKIKSILRVL